MIIIQTFAYNAEKTLARTIQSVLCQTYQNFEYHILDNGSSDKTGKILKNYAKKDDRIKAWFSRHNNVPAENPDFWDLTKKIPEGDYFCILDADDTYEPTFFEDMLQFAETNNLGIAACGSTFLDCITELPVGGHILSQDIILDDKNKLDAGFPMVYWNMRQLWGKLYSSKAAAARYGAERPEWMPVYGGDTVNTLESVKKAGSIGVRAKSLHNYYISIKSYSYQWDPKRAEADIILYEAGRAFLREACGRISERNQIYLYLVYFNAVKDTLNVLFGARMDVGNKLSVIRDIMANKITQEMYHKDMSIFGVGPGDKNEFLNLILRWIEEQRAAYTKENILNLQAVYEGFNPEFAQLVPEEKLYWYMQKIPQAMSALAVQDYNSAAKELRHFLSVDTEEVFPVFLAQTLAALSGDEKEYVRYEKLMIEILIRKGDYEQAKEELDEWKELLPEDNELAEFRKRIAEY